MKESAMLELANQPHRAPITIEGYASLFGSKDFSSDMFEAGAFLKSLGGKREIRMLFNHDVDKCIGRWDEIKEDQNGLFVRGNVCDITTIELINDGVIDGLSVGFKTKKDKRVPGCRRILQADLWEISIVTFPMHQSARFYKVKLEAVANA